MELQSVMDIYGNLVVMLVEHLQINGLDDGLHYGKIIVYIITRLTR